MSFHNNPDYHIPELIEALKAHRLPHDTPSQLADSFRIGWMARASHGQAPAGAAEEIDKALNVYAQAFAARVNGWTRQNGDDLPGARSALFAAIHAYAQASTRPTTSPQADSVQEDAARESEYRRGYRHGYEQRDAEVRGAMA